MNKTCAGDKAKRHRRQKTEWARKDRAKKKQMREELIKSNEEFQKHKDQLKSDIRTLQTWTKLQELSLQCHGCQLKVLPSVSPEPDPLCVWSWDDMAERDMKSPNKGMGGIGKCSVWLPSLYYGTAAFHHQTVAEEETMQHAAFKQGKDCTGTVKMAEEEQHSVSVLPKQVVLQTSEESVHNSSTELFPCLNTVDNTMTACPVHDVTFETTANGLLSEHLPTDIPCMMAMYGVSREDNFT